MNTANLVASVALIAGGVWAWLGERGWPAPSAVLRVYSPMLAALRWYGSEPVGAKVLAVLIAILSLSFLLVCLLFSFKIHLEEVAVIVLGVPFYLVFVCCFLLAAGVVIALVRLLHL
jgi:hypothetical protein